jgi:hypothetical protein
VIQQKQADLEDAGRNMFQMTVSVAAAAAAAFMAAAAPAGAAAAAGVAAAAVAAGPCLVDYEAKLL